MSEEPLKPAYAQVGIQGRQVVIGTGGKGIIWLNPAQTLQMIRMLTERLEKVLATPEETAPDAPNIIRADPTMLPPSPEASN